MATKFYTHYNRPPAEATPAGDEFEILYDLTYGEFGEPILVPNGQKKPLRAAIQANLNYGVVDLEKAYHDYLMGDDIQIIIKRAEEINPMEGFFGDFSEFPDSPIELLTKLKKTAFNINVDGSMPADVIKSEVKEGSTDGT